MKNPLYIILTIVALITALCEPGIAGGIGLYGSWSNGKNYIKRYLTSPIIIESDFDRNVMSYGGGFVADTNLGGESVFNYRFRLGYDYEVLEADKSCYMNRLIWSNTFGAGVYRDDKVRIWLGPQIGIGYYWGMDNMINNVSVFGRQVQTVVKYKERSMLNVHLGLVLGLNVNITEHFSLAFEGGMRFNIYYDLHRKNHSTGDKYFTGKKDNPRRFENTFPVMGPEGYLSLGFMFRFLEAKKDKEKVETIQDVKAEKVK